MVNDILKDLEGGIAKAHDGLKKELAKVRTGRANLALLDGVRVDYYGTPTPLNQVGNLSTPDPTLIQVQPWDAKLLGAIEKAIRQSDLDLNPQNDGKIIRIPVPPLTEERRKTLVKHAHKYAEEGRVAIRNVRRDVNDHLKKSLKDHEVSEDDEKQAVAEVQKLTDQHIEQINEALKKKEAEIMEV
jgi:ribosome recycling factor